MTPPPDDPDSPWNTLEVWRGRSAGEQQDPASGDSHASGGHPGGEAIPAAQETYQASSPYQTQETDRPRFQQAKAPPRKRGFFQRAFRDVVFPLVAAIGIALFAQATIAKPYQIPSGSMLPTIQVNDRILANRLVYKFSSIERGDVVVFRPPTSVEQDTPYVKRVVGLPGDEVEIRSGQVLVNGGLFLVPQATDPTYTKAKERVPEGQLFVLGDNRNESSDSHIWGFVPEENIIGKAQIIYWPPEHIGMLGN